MGMAFQYQGASGKTYEFLLINMDNPKAIPWHGGLFAFTRYTPDPLFFGEGINLNEAIRTSAEWALLDGERSTQGAPVGYILLEDDERKRKAALADLVERYQPQLNR